jgi:hypothetical protein
MRRKSADLHTIVMPPNRRALHKYRTPMTLKVFHGKEPLSSSVAFLFQMLWETLVNQLL